MNNFLKIFMIFGFILAINACNKIDDDTCSNGVQDGTETGIDCGGVCQSCPPTPAPTPGPTPTPTPTPPTVGQLSLSIDGVDQAIVSVDGFLSEAFNGQLLDSSIVTGLGLRLEIISFDSLTNDTTSMTVRYFNDDINATSLPLGAYTPNLDSATINPGFRWSLITTFNVSDEYEPFFLSVPSDDVSINLGHHDFVNLVMSGDFDAKLENTNGLEKDVVGVFTDINIIDER